MTEYQVTLTDEEIDALIDLDYYGGEHIYSSWDEGESLPLMDLVERAIEKMKEARTSD